MSQSKDSQVIVDDGFEGLILRFGYPSFDANISLKSNKYSHTINLEQAKHIRDKLNEVLDEQEIHSKLANYELCYHCSFMKQIKKIIEGHDFSTSKKIGENNED